MAETGTTLPAHKVVHKGWGKQVRSARKAQGLTQIDLAALIGVEQNTISRIETGTIAPSDKLKLTICLALNRSLDDLFGWPEGALQIAELEEMKRRAAEAVA
jgi:putative transcriptional regulator